MLAFLKYLCTPHLMMHTKACRCTSYWHSTRCCCVARFVFSCLLFCFLKVPERKPCLFSLLWDWPPRLLRWATGRLSRTGSCPHCHRAWHKVTHAYMTTRTLKALSLRPADLSAWQLPRCLGRWHPGGQPGNDLRVMASGCQNQNGSESFLEKTKPLPCD